MLSPLLFNLHLRGMNEVLPADVRESMYADDLLLYTRQADPHLALARLEEAVGLLTPWLRELGLSISIPKCQLCFFTRDRSGLHNIVMEVDGCEIRLNIWGWFLMRALLGRLTLNTSPERLCVRLAYIGLCLWCPGVSSPPHFLPSIEHSTGNRKDLGSLPSGVEAFLFSQKISSIIIIKKFHLVLRDVTLILNHRLMRSIW